METQAQFFEALTMEILGLRPNSLSNFQVTSQVVESGNVLPSIRLIAILSILRPQAAKASGKAPIKE
jgi:hypothetical protein